MHGLLIKDFLVLRKALFSYAIFLGFYGVLGGLGLFPFSFVLTFVQVILMMLPLSAFAFDEAAKWNRYAMSLPLGRRRVVVGRYLFLLLLMLSATAFDLLLCVLMSIGGHAALSESLYTLLGSMGGGLVIASILIPLNYKLGPERSRPYLYALMLLPICIVYGAFRLGLLDNADFSSLNSLPALAGMTLFPVVALVGLFLSYLVSCRIVEAKEF